MVKVPKRSKKASRKSSTENKPTAGPRLSQAQLYAMGKSLREKCPRNSHAVWKAPHDRPDPLRCWRNRTRGAFRS